MSDARTEKHVQTLPLASAQAGLSVFRPLLFGENSPSRATAASEPKADPYALGMQEGQEIAAAAFEMERDRFQAMLKSAAAFQPEATEEIARLVSETVITLVCQIIEDAPIDAAWLNAQVQKAADVIGDCDASRTLRLNPDDLALLDASALPLPVLADPNLPHGELRIDSSAGWIEHGRSAYLNALRAALAPRESA